MPLQCALWMPIGRRIVRFLPSGRFALDPAAVRDLVEFSGCGRITFPCMSCRSARADGAESEPVTKLGRKC